MIVKVVLSILSILSKINSKYYLTERGKEEANFQFYPRSTLSSIGK